MFLAPAHGSITEDLIIFAHKYDIMERQFSRNNKVLAGILLAAFILYPHINGIFFDMGRWIKHGEAVPQTFIWIVRYIILTTLCIFLINRNLRVQWKPRLISRLGRNIMYSLPAWGLFIIISLSAGVHYDCFTGLLLYQFVIAAATCTIIGHLYGLYIEKVRQSKEIEILRSENLQSKVDALISQINPHFFFNSLNSLTSLIRCDKKEKSLEYIQKLSEVFRYILRSDKQRMATLREELKFIEAFIYLQKVRYADNFSCKIDVSEAYLNSKLPILSILPLIENVVKHNVIDSENPMKVNISIENGNVLSVENPVCEKFEPVESNKIGLRNLGNRFELLTGKSIAVNESNGRFTVVLPLEE